MIKSLLKYSFTEPFRTQFIAALVAAGALKQAKRDGTVAPQAPNEHRASKAQLRYLTALGYKGSPDLTKAQASAEIGLWNEIGNKAQVIQFAKTKYLGLCGVSYIKANGDGTFKAGRSWKGHYQERDSVLSVIEAYQWIAEVEVEDEQNEQDN